MKFSRYMAFLSSVFPDDGDGEIRTLDPLLARQVLSQLSYAPLLCALRQDKYNTVYLCATHTDTLKKTASPFEFSNRCKQNLFC